MGEGTKARSRPGFGSARAVAAALACGFAAWPARADAGGAFLDVLFLRAYNTRLVVLATMVLGVAAGVTGAFLLLRKRSLVGDALSHATLPGIALGFLVMVAAGGTGKALPGLLLGAAVFGLLGVGSVMAIRRLTRLSDDAAMGIVLSVFFGFGVVLLTMVQDSPRGSAAGLESFIYGKTASIVAADFRLIAIAAGAVLIGTLLLKKELTVLCFDDGFAAAQGWPVAWLDAGLLGLVTAVTVIGLQAVGLILIIALLIIPAAAARFWTDRLSGMLALAGAIGAVSGWIGGSASALLPRLPAGAVIVLAAAGIFGLSMLLGPARGLLPRAIDRWRLKRTTERQHLLRAIWEFLEVHPERDAAPIEALRRARSWSPARLRRLLRQFEREGLVRRASVGWAFTEAGEDHAARIVRNHRLWEMYLIAHADVAPSHVDRDADRIEHVLGPAMIERLEGLLHAGAGRVPTSPHVIQAAAPGPEERTSGQAQDAGLAPGPSPADRAGRGGGEA